MNLISYAEQYQTEGFVVLKNCLEETQLKAARTLFLEAFGKEIYKTAPHSGPHIINDIYAYYPQTLPWLITPELIAAVKEILGPDAVWLPECSVHRNRYIGWHKDTSIQARSGLHSHESDNAPIIQCAVYLQDNDPLTGGGLTLIRGSHKTHDHFSPMLTESLPARMGYKLLKTLGLSAFDKADQHPQKEDVLSRLGDVVLFDVRTDHRATQPHANTAQTTDKLAVFNTFGVDSPALRDYFGFMKARTEPYYQYYRETPLPQAVWDWGQTLGIPIWY